jgi:ankyrin repeat protein
MEFIGAVARLVAAACGTAWRDLMGKRIRKPAPDPITMRLLLMRAVVNGDAGALTALLRVPGTDPNGPGAGLLFKAVKHGHAHMVRLLLSQPGIDPNRARLDGTTALMCAAAADRPDIVASLLSHPATDTGMSRGVGATASSLAEHMLHRQCIAALMSGRPRRRRDHLRLVNRG